MVINCSENASTTAVIEVAALARASLAGQQATAAVGQVPHHEVPDGWSERQACYAPGSLICAAAFRNAAIADS